MATSRLRDVIIVHMISADAQIYQQTQKMQSNLRTSRPCASCAAGW